MIPEPVLIFLVGIALFIIVVVFILDETFIKLQQVNIPNLVKDSIDFIVNSGKLYFNIDKDHCNIHFKNNF